MQKLLFISNIIYSGRVGGFSHSSILAAKELGYEFHMAVNWCRPETREHEESKHGIIIHHIDFIRNPLHPGNIKAYWQLARLMMAEKFDIVHCNTPVGGFIGRLAAKRCGIKKVIYQAHGFHFHMSSPFLNWLSYYPVEKLLARYFTNVLITINKEDYALAKKKMNTKKIYYIPGVGVDTTKFMEPVVDKKLIRAEAGIPDHAVLILSVGELSKNKNHEVIIRAIAKLNNNVHFCIAGQGSLKEYLENITKKLNVNEKIHFLGFRTDVNELCKVADIFCFPSKREGLGLAAIEAMASGLPIITSNIHGINDYSKDGVTGYSCRPNSVEDFKCAIEKLVQDTNKRITMGERNKLIAKKFDIHCVIPIMREIYTTTLTEDC